MEGQESGTLGARYSGLSAATRRRLLRAGAAAAGAATYMAPRMHRLALAQAVACTPGFVDVDKTIDALESSSVGGFSCQIRGKIIFTNNLKCSVTVNGLTDTLSGPSGLSQGTASFSPDLNTAPQTVAPGETLTINYIVPFKGVAGPDVTIINTSTISITPGPSPLTATASLRGSVNCP
jgi:hypothetical protein